MNVSRTGIPNKLATYCIHIYSIYTELQYFSYSGVQYAISCLFISYYWYTVPAIDNLWCTNIHYYNEKLVNLYIGNLVSHLDTFKRLSKLQTATSSTKQLFAAQA